VDNQSFHVLTASLKRGPEHKDTSASRSLATMSHGHHAPALANTHTLSRLTDAEVLDVQPMSGEMSVGTTTLTRSLSTLSL
jgi:hypothetical protein